MVKVILMSLAGLASQHVVQEGDGQWYVVAQGAPQRVALATRQDFSSYNTISPLRGVQVTAPGAHDLPIQWVVHFKTDSARVSDADAARLRTMAPRFQLIRVEGHADPRGDAKHNTALSQHRAQAVATILKQAGAAHIDVRFFGESQPLCRDETAACYAKDRRGVVRAKENQSP